MRRPSWFVCIATDTVTRQWCSTVNLKMLSLAVPRWKRATEGRRPKDRSLEGGSLVSPGLASQRDRFLTAKQGRLLYQRHCSKTPRCRGVGTPCWAGPLTTSLRGLWVSGYLPRAMADRAARGGDPKTDQEETTRTLGWHPEEKSTLVTATRGVLSNQRGLHQCEKGRGPKDPTVRGAGTREPRRRGAICCCELSRQPQVRRVWTVTYVSLFETVPKTLERAVNIILPSLNDDITHATDVLIVGKPVPVGLSVDLLVVCCLPSVVPSALCRRAVKVSRLGSSCLSLTSLFPHCVSSLWTT